MIAFVTGGTGFVGGHLCERLRADGWTVRALARRSSNTSTLDKAGCEIVRGELDAEKVIRRSAADAHVVFHLAGVTKALARKTFFAVNAEGTKRVLLAAHEGGFAGRFVLLSSLAAAGPAPEGRPRSESDEPRPVSWYGQSKLSGERLAEKARDAFPVTILRPGAIYGPREHEMFEIIKPLQRTGISLSAGPDIRLQMTHVDDVVAALAVAASHESLLNRTYFVNDPQAWRYSDVMRLMGEALGRSIRQVRVPLAVGWAIAGALDLAGKVARRPLSPLGRDKMREISAGSWLADSSALSRDCAWSARVAFPEGIAQTIRWYRDNKWL